MIAPMLITDRGGTAVAFDKAIEEALRGGCRRLLYRDNKASAAEKLLNGVNLCEKMRMLKGQFFVSHDVDIALALGADGVHLKAAQSVKTARQKASKLTIGQSCHNAEEIRRAIAEGADYVTLSPIFATASKPGYGPELGLSVLEECVKVSSIPILALGGITAANAVGCIEAGAAGIAVMGMVMHSPAPHQAMQDLIAALEGAQGKAA
jgi:thiamine-phosphate pyrophosphorylase